MQTCLPLRCRSAGCRGRSADPAALAPWRPDTVIILAVLGVTSHNRAVFLPIIGIAMPTTTGIVLKVVPVLAGGWLHGWPGISQLTVVIALIVRQSWRACPTLLRL